NPAGARAGPAEPGGGPPRAHAEPAGTPFLTLSSAIGPTGTRGDVPAGPFCETALTPSRGAAIIDSPSYAHPPGLADALPARRTAPQDDAVLHERDHAPVPEGPHPAPARGLLHRRAHARARRGPGRARGRRGRIHGH